MSDDQLFSFKHATEVDGKKVTKTYHLPSGATKANEIPGRFLRDAYMNGAEGEMRLGFALLELVDADEGAVEALYDMPASEMMPIVRDWMRFKPADLDDEGDDASLGESSASSS